MGNKRVDYIERKGNTLSGQFTGELPNKSNSRKVYRLAGGRMIFGKAEKALDFVRRVKVVAKHSRTGNVLVGATSLRDLKRGGRLFYLKAHVYGENFMRDLDVELLPDALQEAGLINNDRAIRQKFYWWTLDKTDPRIEWELGYIIRGEEATS